MKLTNAMRDSFISSVMKDVPVYGKHHEDARKILTDQANANLPKKVRDLYKNPELKKYMRMGYTTYRKDAFFVSIYAPLPEGTENITCSPEALEQLEAFANEWHHEQETITNLHRKLKNAVYGCSTVKQLQELLPEFSKYIPIIPEKSRSLPVISNMVGDFIRAGWPKEKHAP